MSGPFKNRVGTNVRGNKCPGFGLSMSCGNVTSVYEEKYFLHLLHCVASKENRAEYFTCFMHACTSEPFS